jgi:hypothetical protein
MLMNTMKRNYSRNRGKNGSGGDGSAFVFLEAEDAAGGIRG